MSKILDDFNKISADSAKLATDQGSVLTAQAALTAAQAVVDADATARTADDATLSADLRGRRSPRSAGRWARRRWIVLDPGLLDPTPGVHDHGGTARLKLPPHGSGSSPARRCGGRRTSTPAPYPSIGDP